jgi:hypothetical protein
MVSQNNETYFVAESRNRLTPLYGFFDTRLRGSPAALHGRRQGTIPRSSKLMIFSVTIRISAVTFECDLEVMIEKMLDSGFGDPEKEMADLVIGPLARP